MPYPARRNRAFTLMELIIVTIIIGVIAGFAIPNYQKAIARQQVKRLILTTDLTAGAQEIYKTKNSRYWCDFSPLCAQLSNINSNLGINIMPETGVTYSTYATTGFEDQSFQIIITDGTLFSLNTSSPPLNTVCTNISAMNVCP